MSYFGLSHFHWIYRTITLTVMALSSFHCICLLKIFPLKKEIWRKKLETKFRTENRIAVNFKFKTDLKLGPAGAKIYFSVQALFHRKNS